MENVKEKILLLLFGGFALGFCRTPGRQRMAINAISHEWRKIKQKELKAGVSYLYRLGFIDKGIIKKGNGFIFLTNKGKLRALNSQLANIKKKGKWDGKWRMVSFDIPQDFKTGRDALRRKLKSVGFCELQKSVLITPYDCRKEIELLVKLFNLDKYVRFGILEWIDNEDYLKRQFKIIS